MNVGTPGRAGEGFADQLGLYGTGEPVLEVRGLRKAFPGVQALAGADLTVRRGEVHALIGANGAGKSTLIKILAGLQSADAGSVLVDGRPVHIDSPRRSRDLGLAFIHQELALVPRLSVAENLMLATMPSRWGIVRRRELRHRAEEALSAFLPGVDPSAPVSDLAVAQQWLVSLARVHLQDARIVFLDEPTAALGAHEVEVLFDVVRHLAAQEVSVVFVSHRLAEVLAITDHVTALRAGLTVGTQPTAQCTRSTLVEYITGHSVADNTTVTDNTTVAGGTTVADRSELPDVGPVLELDRLSSGPVRDVSLALRGGEVLGIGGLVGSGRSELLETVFGARPVEAGRMLLDGRPVRFRSPADAMRVGIALLPEDRHGMAIFASRSIRVNTVVAHLHSFARRVTRSPVRAREDEATIDKIARLRIAATGPSQRVSELSGGNQQKVVVSRWLCGPVRVFLVDEPTKGVDVEGKAEILRELRRLAAENVAVVVVSSELEEVASVADRVVVLREGRLVAELAGPTTETAILAACFSEEAA